MMKHREATLRAPVRLISGLAWSPHYQITQFIVLMEALRLNRSESSWPAESHAEPLSDLSGLSGCQKKKRGDFESPLKYRVLGTMRLRRSHLRGEMDPKESKL